MRIDNLGRYMRVYIEEGNRIDPDMFLGWKYRKGDNYYTVENTIVNRIVLGLEVPGFYNADLKYVDGLMDYQRRDVAKMVSRSVGLNRNRMGYGKTVETVAMLRELRVLNAVIVAPKPVLQQWKSQLEYWWPEIKNRIVMLDKKTTHIAGDSIVLVNYEKLLQTQILYKLKSRVWDMLIVDEVHRIKNRNSKRTIAVKEIPASGRWGLTGTPILKNPDDLWSILHFLSVEYSGISYWNFVDYFCNVVDGFFGRRIEGLTKNEAKVDVLRKLLDNISISNPDLNITKGKVVETVSVSMTAPQKQMYKNAVHLILDSLPEEMTIPNGAVLCKRLQQITSTPRWWDSKNYGAKFEYILSVLEDNPDEKIVVFSAFATTCEYLQKFLKEHKIKCVTYTGRMAESDKALAKIDFIGDPDCRVIAGTIGAMGVGVDGLQDVCRIGMFLERDWSPEINAQAEDRLNRYGQKDLVLIQYIECKGTYDRHVGRVTLTRAEDIRSALKIEEDM